MVDSEIIKTNKRDKVYWFKLFLGLVIFIIWCVLIGVKYSNKDFSLKYWFIGAGILTGLFILSFIAKGIVEKIGKGEATDKIPEPLNSDEVLKLVYKTIQGTREKNYLDGYFRNIKKIGEINPYHINKNLIYSYEVFLSDKITLSGKETDRVLIIVNATYPNIKPAVKLPILSDYKIEKQVNAISSSPKDDPIVERSKEGLDPFGKPIRETEKITPKTENEQKPKEDSVV